MRRVNFRHPRRAGALAVLLLLAVAALLFRWRRAPPEAGGPGQLDAAAARQLVAELTALEARESRVAETVWADELLAQRCGQVFERLWDTLNQAPDALGAAASFPFGQLAAPRFGPPAAPGHDILVRAPTGARELWSPSDWRRWLGQLAAAGWRLDQTEFRHNRFEPGAAGGLSHSRFYFTAHLQNALQPERAALVGELGVAWATNSAIPDGLPEVTQIDASRLSLLTRRGPPSFRRILIQRIEPPEKSHFIDPLMVRDLDGDGRSEIVLAAKNRVFRLMENREFRSEPLCRYSPGLIFTAVLADFDGDDATDFLCAHFGGLSLHKGSAQGSFDEPPRQAWEARPHLRYGQVMTCGDVDGDGDLDLWLGQYKNPYERGQMPTPFYDANDGHPAYLLLNDGGGRFTDATASSGLEAKRWRRSYSGSLLDLDDDGDLDLFTVNDFAGTDVYQNDGKGHFRELTSSWIPQAKGFGMAHAFGDFNADGRADVFVTGMHCPTGLRINHLGLFRPERPDYLSMGAAMLSGNKLFAGNPGPGFRVTPLNESVAHSGWSWGCTVLDFDNDGLQDLYVGNGHETRQSTRDYDSEFWLHDIYVGDSKDSVLANAYFGGKFARTRGQGHSYGGYEKNRLYWNRQGSSFLEVGYLLGVGLQNDTRNVVSEDLDADGGMDVVLTTFEVWPERVQTLQVFRNELAGRGHWVGLIPCRDGNACLPPGTRANLLYPGGRSTRHFITGDSHRTQQSGLIHFGLGQSTSLDAIELRLPNGRSQSVTTPITADAYHALPAISAGDQPRTLP